MRRTILLLVVAALIAVMMALTASPAVAQVSFGIGSSDNESGEITTDNSFFSWGSSWDAWSSWW
jgi:hypothetical protein